MHLRRGRSVAPRRGGPRGKRVRGVGGRALALLLLLAGPAGAGDGSERAATRAAMSQIFGAIELLLPLSVDDAAFRDPARRQEILAALATVRDQAAQVSHHAQGSDRRVEYLGASLAREAGETRERFQRGQVEASQFFVQRFTEFCVACHSRLPSSQDSPLAADFVSKGALAAQPPERRAALEVATRRFDDALATYEEIIASPNLHPAELLDPITRYLTVSIRVKNDLARPIPTLTELSKRPDLWRHLRGDVRAWISTLRDHARQPASEPSLENAQRLIDEGRREIRFPSDRRALVHYLLASAELHRFLERHPALAGRDGAEAYYLLGLVESRIDGSYTVSEANAYLEAAIRMAPKEPVAADAYSLLEEETVLGWTGSGGENVPPDVQQHLDELRALIEEPASK